MDGASPWHDIRQPLLERCAAVSGRDWFLTRAKKNETKWTVFKRDAETIARTIMFPMLCVADVMLLIIRLLFKVAWAIVAVLVFISERV